MKFVRKPLFFLAGCLSLILGVVGAFLPVLPTTPFVLLASYFFFHSSKVMHDWLLSHRTFGPLIRDWESYGIIRPSAKRLASVMIILSFCYPLFFKDFSLWFKFLLLITELSVLSFIWTRPSSRQEGSHQEDGKTFIDSKKTARRT